MTPLASDSYRFGEFELSVRSRTLLLKNFAAALISQLLESLGRGEADLRGVVHSRFQIRDGCGGLHLAQRSGGRLSNVLVFVLKRAFDNADDLGRGTDGAESGNGIDAMLNIFIGHGAVQNIPRVGDQFVAGGCSVVGGGVDWLGEEGGRLCKRQ